MTQETILTNEQLSLVKNTFAEEDKKINAIRKFFYQLPLSEDETKILKEFNKSTLSMLRNVLVPEINGDQKLRYACDLWSAIDQDFENKIIDDCLIMIKGRKIHVDYIKSRMNDLENNTETAISFKDLTNTDKVDEETYANLVARNAIVVHIENQMSFIKAIAGKKDETEEETIARLKLDSNK